MKRQRVCLVMFWAYCILMAWLLFGRTRLAVVDGYWNTLSNHLNLVPFYTIRLFVDLLLADSGDGWQRLAIVNLLGNVLMFLPLGFFPPLLWKGLRKLWKMLLGGTVIIVCVELIQLFCLVGKCDVDDLILNLVGIAVGYGLYRGANRM